MNDESRFRRSVLSAFAIAGLALWSSSASAQASPETTHGQLTLWSSGLGAGEGLVGATRRKAATAGEDVLIALLRRNAALGNPVGYGVRMHRSDGESLSGRVFGLPFIYGVDSWIWYLGWDDDGRGGRTIDMSNGKFSFTILVNGVGRAGDTNDTVYVDHGPPFLRGYKETGRYRGHAVYDGECVFLTRNSAPALVPVTKERYLKVKILAARQDSARHLAQQVAQGSNPMAANLAAYIRERPKREADVRNAYTEMKKIDPAAAEQFLAQWKKADADGEAQMRAAAPDLDSQIREKRTEGNAAFAEALQKVQAELDALSPSERKRPAYIVDLGMNQTRLAKEDDSDQVLLNQINMAAFDKTLGESVPQVISVCLPGLQPDVVLHPSDWNAQRARDAVLIRDGLDWVALEAMVKSKP